MIYLTTTNQKIFFSFVSESMGYRLGVLIIFGVSENVSNKKYNEKEKINDIRIIKAIFLINFSSSIF